MKCCCNVLSRPIRMRYVTAGTEVLQQSQHILDWNTWKTPHVYHQTCCVSENLRGHQRFPLEGGILSICVPTERFCGMGNIAAGAPTIYFQENARGAASLRCGGKVKEPTQDAFNLDGSSRWSVCLDNLLQTSARIMRSSLYGQRIPAQFCNTQPKCLVSTNKQDADGSSKHKHQKHI